MGIRVSTIYAISLNDTHEYFLYHLPTQSFEHRWIDEWIDSRFNQIAEALGPRGMLVVSHSRNLIEYESEIYNHISRLSHNFRDDGKELRRGERPFLILSRRPLQEAMEGECVKVRIEDCKSETNLAEIFDIVLEIIKSDDWESIDRLRHLPSIEAEYAHTGPQDALPGLVLTPSVAGVGINLNHILGWVVWRLRRLRR